MRIQFLLLFILGGKIWVNAQPQAENFPDLLIYRADEKDPFLEVWYTESMRKLENGIEQTFRAAGGKKANRKSDSTGVSWTGIAEPVYSGGNYTLRMEIRDTRKKGNLIRFRLINDTPAFNLLNPQMGIFQSLAEQLQNIIDEIQQIGYYDTDQQANVMYLFSPKEEENNLNSYLFIYSKAPKDSTMKKLVEWMVFACEAPRMGSWINDSTFRVDDLRQRAFGISGSFSLTITHSIVQGDYNQYEIYLSNYISKDNENNYQVRPYDVHKRLWRYYNTLLFIQKSGRR